MTPPVTGPDDLDDEPERDWHQEYKDDLAQGLINEDGSPCDPDEPDWDDAPDATVTYYGEEAPF